MVLELRASCWVICGALGYWLAAAVAVSCSGAAPGLVTLGGVVLGLGAWRLFPQLLHGRAGRALRRIEWLGGDEFILVEGGGRRAPARLLPASRRLGRAVILVFDARPRHWVFLLPGMTDAAAGRKLRVFLGLRRNVLRGPSAAPVVSAGNVT
jgi:hypothetical protein